MGSDETRWHSCRDRDALETQAFDLVTRLAQSAIRARGVFRVVLSGGTTPRGVYQRLAARVRDFNGWDVYFGDERCLPADHPERNSSMARAAGLARIAADHFHAIPAEHGARLAAQRYSDLLRTVPDFDLVLLGLGEDGHTASLFPGHAWDGANGSEDVLAVHDAPKPPPERVSMSAHRLARAHAVWFLVDGEAKRAAIKAWRQQDDIPARAIRPARGVDVLVEQALLD